MNETLKFSKKDLEIIKEAIIEYEANHYSTKDDEWQDRVNNLITILKNKTQADNQNVNHEYLYYIPGWNIYICDGCGEVLDEYLHECPSCHAQLLLAKRSVNNKNES